MKRFLRDDRGATAVEYSLIATMMAIGLISAFPILSSGINNLFEALAASLPEIP